MKIYTRGGDQGKTSVIGGRRFKHDLRIHAYGALDEVNSFIGQARVICERSELHVLKPQLLTIQHELFDCGSDLATVKEDAVLKVQPAMIEQLEAWIDAYTEKSPQLERFILPGGSELAASLHVCRTETRRAERAIVELKQEEPIHEPVLQYVNRLSDYFFAAARFVNHSLNVSDVEYERSAIVFKE